MWLKDTEGRQQAVNRLFAEAAGIDDLLGLVGKTDAEVWPAKRPRPTSPKTAT